MPIIIAILTAVSGIIWALYRLQNSGVDLNAFNPFYWARRRSWEKKLGVRPLHRIDNSMEAAAVLVVGMAELEGSITRELKQQVLSLFKSEFNISDSEANSLYVASSHLLRDTVNIADEVKHILSPTIDQYQPRHRESLLSMLQQTGDFDGQLNQNQQRLLKSVEHAFVSDTSQAKSW